MGEGEAKAMLARETVTFEGRLGIQHRDILEALAKNQANVGIIFAHLARYYARTFPDLVEMIEVPGADRFSSTIALTEAAAPLHPHAAIAFEEFFLAGRKIIPARDGGALGEEAVDEAGADEPGGAGDEDVLHGNEGPQSREGAARCQLAMRRTARSAAA